VTASGSPPFRVVLVCTGNTCRSAIGEALLRQALTARGVAGVDLSPHRARLLTPEVATSAGLLLTMARHHRSRVLELVPDARVHLLGEFAGRRGAEAEVADPYGADLEMYRTTRDDLASMMDAVAARIAAEYLDDRR